MTAASAVGVRRRAPSGWQPVGTAASKRRRATLASASLLHPGRRFRARRLHAFRCLDAVATALPFVTPPQETAHEQARKPETTLSQGDARTYLSRLGKVVYQQDAWYALLDYKTLAPPARPGGLPSWVKESRRLGPFKRPRNAMIALEREAVFLKNRHGKDVLIGEELWAEA